jgi:hypothetical protein
MRKNSSLISLTLRRAAAGVVFSFAREPRADVVAYPIRSPHPLQVPTTHRMTPWLICLFGPLASTMALSIGVSGSSRANPLP